jgi:hypothetical protein
MITVRRDPVDIRVIVLPVREDIRAAVLPVREDIRTTAHPVREDIKAAVRRDPVDIRITGRPVRVDIRVVIQAGIKVGIRVTDRLEKADSLHRDPLRAVLEDLVHKAHQVDIREIDRQDRVDSDPDLRRAEGMPAAIVRAVIRLDPAPKTRISFDPKKTTVTAQKARRGQVRVEHAVQQSLIRTFR